MHGRHLYRCYARPRRGTLASRIAVMDAGEFVQIGTNEIMNILKTGLLPTFSE